MACCLLARPGLTTEVHSHSKRYLTCMMSGAASFRTNENQLPACCNYYVLQPFVSGLLYLELGSSEVLDAHTNTHTHIHTHALLEVWPRTQEHGGHGLSSDTVGGDGDVCLFKHWPRVCVCVCVCSSYTLSLVLRVLATYCVLNQLLYCRYGDQMKPWLANLLFSFTSLHLSFSAMVLEEFSHSSCFFSEQACVTVDCNSPKYSRVCKNKRPKIV